MNDLLLAWYYRWGRRRATRARRSRSRGARCVCRAALPAVATTRAGTTRCRRRGGASRAQNAGARARRRCCGGGTLHRASARLEVPFDAGDALGPARERARADARVIRALAQATRADTSFLSSLLPFSSFRFVVEFVNADRIPQVSPNTCRPACRARQVRFSNRLHMGSGKPISRKEARNMAILS